EVVAGVLIQGGGGTKERLGMTEEGVVAYVVIGILGQTEGSLKAGGSYCIKNNMTLN
ncbi:hypothetical protein A2U01_0078356, partial [Trifolium medium]|nr:hypothetical protein [Trifolium medium]